MKKNFLENIKKAHCIGIGGSGLSGLAKLLHHKGAIVSGSNQNENEASLNLKNKYKLKINFGHTAENIPENTDLVIYSRAVSEKNPERQAAKKKNIPEFSYPEFLGEISKNMNTLAVAGTNGKTTTTGMLAEIFDDYGLQANVIIGGVMQKFSSNYLDGKSDIFITEACEYRRSFLNIKHNALIITNITLDHLDYYENLQDIQKAFCELLNQHSSEKVLITNTEDPALATVLSHAKALNYKIINFMDEKFYPGKLSIPGKHNELNARAVLAYLALHTENLESAKKYLRSSYQGVKRRMQYIGENNYAAKIFDDYAHNPEGLDFLISGIKKHYPKKKISIFFEPHLYTRTEDFAAEFSEVLAKADSCYLLPVYKAREAYNPEKEFLLKKHIPDAYIVKNYEDAKAIIYGEKFNDNDIVITAGAGELYEIHNK